MNKNILACSAAFLMFSTLNATSQTSMNRGNETCDKWAVAHSSPQATADSTAFDNWVFGYLQGEATIIEGERRTKGLPPINILRGLDGPTIVRLTGEFCRTKPLGTIAEAVGELAAQAVADNSAPRPGEAPAKVQITADRPLAETTGSADITGSIGSVHKCETVSIKDSANDTIRKFRECN